MRAGRRGALATLAWLGRRGHPAVARRLATAAAIARQGAAELAEMPLRHWLDVFWRWRPESLAHPTDAAAADGDRGSHNHLQKKKGLPAWQQRGCRELMWSHSCQQVFASTFERVFADLAAAGSRASQDKQGELTLSSRCL